MKERELDGTLTRLHYGKDNIRALKPVLSILMETDEGMDVKH